MIVTAIDLSHGLEGILNSLMTQGAALGWTLIKALSLIHISEPTRP